MAGDHKCPVCNSTFTRPQHVARHMRSHTGDRPYKCQHCGDQFARSDLLSRHINKCHASEKPPTTTAPNNRRKGTAAASRATTSKQACDQCVTSSLPCDGCNPCSKCVQRKCRCTYVKFHRQTAPAGPGHPPPNTLPNAPHRGGLPLGARLPDEFLMQPTGAAGGLGSMYLPADYGLPGASMYAPNPYDSRPSTASSLSMSTGARETEPSPEMLARYRAQAELLSRAGVLPSGALAGMGAAGTVMPGMYNPDSATFARYGLASSQAPAWGQPGGHPYAGKDLADYGNDVQSFPGGGGSAALSSHPPTHGAPFTNIPSTSGHASGSDAHATAAGYGGGIPFPQHHPTQGHPSAHHRRSEELSDDYGSDSGISVPSSANSSSVHLPMDGSQRRPYTAESASPTIPYQNSARKDDGTNEGGFSSAFGLMSLDDPNVLAGLANDSAPFFSALTQFSHGEGDNQSANSSTTSLHTESSANDGSSQTSHTSESSVGSMGNMGLSLPTPTPELIASLKNGGLLSAGGREALDSKELREFWKQYMRTPLTGPGANTPLFPLQTPTGPGHQLGAGMAGSSTTSATGRPSPTRRHSRVASLPSMKTPPILGQGTTPELNSFAPVGSFSLSLGPKARERQSQHQASQDDQHAHDDRGHQHPQMSYSGMRTTLHGDADDLKSYEQAVLARKAPTTLNLVPRRRGTMPAGSSAPSVTKQAHMSPPQLPGQVSGTVGTLPQATNPNAVSSSGEQAHQQSSNGPGGVGDSSNHERPSSSSSSLADAFGSPQQRHQQQQQEQQHPQDHHYAIQDQYRMHQQHQHSQSSSDSPRESSVGAESDGGQPASYRPSFKRLASQTLGPPNAKRALLGPAGWDDVRRGPEESESIEEDDEVDEDVAASGRFAKHGHEGPRRFSLPATSGDALTLPPIRTAVGGHDQAQSQSPVSTYQQ